MKKNGPLALIFHALFVIFMVQLTPSGTFDFRSQLKALVYPAIV